MDSEAPKGENPTNKGDNLSSYVFLGATVGGFLGATAVLLALAGTREEKKARVLEVQRALLEPVKEAIVRVAGHVGDVFIEALDEASARGAPKDPQPSQPEKNAQR